MTMPAAVFLKKQHIKVQADEEGLGHYIRQKLNGSLQEELIKAMERVFAQGSETDAALHIGKISLDLGTMTLAAFEDQFVGSVEAKLSKALRELFPESPEKTLQLRFYPDHSRENHAPPLGGSFEWLTSEQQELTALFYFLEKGVFPWWIQNQTNLRPQALFSRALHDQGENLILKILAFKKAGDKEAIIVLLERLSIFLDSTKYEELIHLLIHQYNDKTLVAHVDLLLTHRKEILELVYFKNYHQTLFEFLLMGNFRIGENLLYLFLKQGIVDKTGILRPFSIALPHQPGNVLDTALSAVISEKINAERINNEEGFQENLAPSAKNKKTGIKEMAEGVFVHNAGLVLLHPFLGSLFTQAGLLEAGRRFVSTEARHRAAVLLYYLQSGEEDYLEWEMAFNKIICGLEIQDVLHNNIVVSEEDKQRCVQLLEAVVQYWEALKGASTGALQQTFLMRRGKMVWKEGSLLIYIERTGTDILLERLPWGYSTVKFPWLDTIIHTTW